MLDFYQQMAQELELGSGVLATVTAVQGSTPREVGAKMLVCRDGRILGTIGGGAGEAKVHAQALAVLQSGIKQFVEIDLSGTPQQETQGVCGGKMKVWLERWQGAAAIALVQQIIQGLQQGDRNTLITPFHRDQHPHLLPASPLPPLPCPPVSLPPCIGQAQGTAPAHLIEPILPPPLLAIAGAGHVAVPLAQIAQMAGFQVIVIDDRPEFACAGRFATGVKVLVADPAEAISTLPLHTELYAALVTRGYQQDVAPLKVLLNRPTQYIGMIGSHKRVRLVQQELLRTGYSPQQLRQIYAPIGLEIGALTPEEIAVSICAELIQVRRSGKGKVL